MANPEALLKTVPLFEGLSKKELRYLVKQARTEHIPSGKTVVKEGDPGGRFYIILEGLAKVTIRGRKRSTLARGDFFGEISLIDRGPRSATVLAETNMHTLSLSSWDFLALLEENWPMAKKVLEQLCQRARSVEDPITA